MNERRFVCCEDDQPPVSVDPLIMFASWTFPTKSLKSGLYDVIIGLTTTELKVDLIETLTFRFAAADGESVAPSELIVADTLVFATPQLIRKKNLKAMCTPAPEPTPTDLEPMKWRLYCQLEHTNNRKLEHTDNHQLKRTDNRDNMMIEMEFRLSDEASSTIDPGRLDLHFMELHASENVKLCEGGGGSKSLFSVYGHDLSHPLQANHPPKLTASTAHRHCKELNNFHGYGKFHNSAITKQDAQDEVFIAGSVRAVHIFSVSPQKWKLLRTIQSYSVTEIRHPIPLKPLQDYGSAENASYSISDDGTLLVVLGNGLISVNEIASGMELQSVKLPKNYHLKSKAQFMRKDTQLLVYTENSEASYNRGLHGLILNTNDLSIVARILLPGDYINVVKVPGQEDHFYAAHGSKLHRIHLQDCIIQSCSRPYLPPCDETCKCDSIGLRNYPKDYKARNGLQYNVTLEEVNKQATAIVTVTGTGNQNANNVLRIPLKRHNGNEVAFLNKLDRLVVMEQDSIMLWGLPDTMDSDLTYEDNHMRERVERYIGQHINRMWPCEDGNFDWLSHHHRHKGKKDTDKDVWHGSTFEQCISVVSGSSIIRWIPKADMDETSNPVSILLDKAISNPQVMLYVEMIINYCFRKATTDRDMRLMLPVMQCLHRLVDPDQPYTDLALRILRQLAHFRVKHRQFLIENYTIINPPELQLRYWKSDERGLYQCKDPILQMVYPLQRTISRTDDLNEYFTHDLFAASFDLLWRVKVGPSFKISFTADPKSPCESQSWIKNFIDIVQLKRKLTYTAPVKTHDFHLDMLDNPAIAALIEYKWNTIGFKYWLVRFFSQCCFYALVLMAVFKHIYDSHERSPTGLFIAILVSSSFFLLLETVQMIKNWKRYRS
ncbi:hypothetical protein BGZ72_002070 [Mortierella alpina]|nr:hypothetical protein BGZ72_002070 [Mortierella alpina]